MKISRIVLKNFQQFQDFDLDLTYPKGHPKEGQALDKVCIIGQNGTGKTTILEQIKFLVANVTKFSNTPPTAFFNMTFSRQDVKEQVKSIVFWENNTESFRRIESQLQLHSFHSFTNTSLQAVQKMLFFPSGAHFLIPNMPSPQKKSAEKRFFELTADHIKDIQGVFFDNYGAYYDKFIDFSLSLQTKIHQSEDINEDFRNWNKENINPLIDFAEYVNKLLEPAHLKIKTQANKKAELVDIQFLTLRGEKVVPYSAISTGSKNLFLTALALYQLIKDDMLVLFDEPENSIYPDLQRNMIPVYTEIGKKHENVQFFFATHSPIIASNFEPWEIVDLEMDEQGFTQRHKYYEGENHVDNYTIYPEYLRWDTILEKVFDLKFSGNENVREKKLYELSKCESKIRNWQKKGEFDKEKPEIQKVLEERALLLKKLDWETKNTTL